MFLIAFGVLLTAFKTAAAPTKFNPELDPLSHLNVIYKPQIYIANTESVAKAHVDTNSHPIQATKTISEEALRQYLTERHSPLAGFVSSIRDSQYWSTIIGICTIEEYSCSVNPYGTNNLWGLMGNGVLIHFDSLSAGLAAIDAFLAKAEKNGRTTIESFRGWYCASECTNWQSTVIKTKLKLESL